MTPPRIGLALGSGSARIGVIDALMEAGIEPNIVCGASMGSFVGAAFVTGRLIDQAVRASIALPGIFSPAQIGDNAPFLARVGIVGPLRQGIKTREHTLDTEIRLGQFDPCQCASGSHS
jgi:predicted acylesterase/phospholipase RssA